MLIVLITTLLATYLSRNINFCTSCVHLKILLLDCRTKVSSRFVILDRTDHIDKVASDLNDGSFDLLPSDPLFSYYKTVEDWGVKFIW